MNFYSASTQKPLHPFHSDESPLRNLGRLPSRKIQGLVTFPGELTVQGLHGVPVKMQSVPSGPDTQRSVVSAALGHTAQSGPNPSKVRTSRRQLARALVLASHTNREGSPRAVTAVS